MHRTTKIALATMSVLWMGLSVLDTAAAAPDEHDRGRAPETRPAAPPRPDARTPAPRPDARTPALRPDARAPAPRPDARGGAPRADFARPAPGRPGFGPSRPSFDGRGQVLDGRYNHGRYYPPMGTVRPSLPGEYRSYYRGGSRYYFNGGVWYAPRGPSFVVVAPPPGIVISVLPPYYSTVWFGGVPYYYADNVYYTAAPDEGGYVVADAPDNADTPSPPPDSPAPQSDLIVYPKNGQSKEQQAADQFECHNWAKGQTGFDPTQPGGGVAPGSADSSRSNYNRAKSACLQGRGYQVN